MNKERILQEMKRTAEAHGGLPLGMLRFFREIGMKESDRKGKYWARWNDAVNLFYGSLTVRINMVCIH